MNNLFRRFLKLSLLTVIPVLLFSSSAFAQYPDDIRFGVKRVEISPYIGGVYYIYTDGTGTGPCDGNEGRFFVSLVSSIGYDSTLAVNTDVLTMALQAKASGLQLGYSNGDNVVDPWGSTCDGYLTFGPGQSNILSIE